MAKSLWPSVNFYDVQRDIIHSVRDVPETVVPAGNMLGKDFLAGFVCLWYFIAFEEVRIITTSVKDDHLRVLWGEIENFINTSTIPLNEENGGLLRVNHHDIRKVYGTPTDISKSYLRGMVSSKGEGMAGHHAKHTLMIIDEASGVDNEVYTQGDTWAKKKLIIGNPNPCNNFFFEAVMGGSM